jgi:hypothetical protein
MPPTSSSAPERSWIDTAKATYNVAYNAVEPAVSYPLSLIPEQGKLVLAGIGGGALMLGSVAAYKRYFRRIPNAEFVSAKDLQRKRWIKGVVTRCVAECCDESLTNTNIISVSGMPIISDCTIPQA